MVRIAMVQFDSRPVQELGALNTLIARNAAYALLHGYHHVQTGEFERDVPVYWNKVYLVEKYLNAGFDIVAWLDSDAVIHDFNVTIESLFDGDEGFVFSSDPPVWPKPSPFNAGVFFCKGQLGRTLMREWGALYPGQLWKKQDGKWNYDDHLWAGPAFEQGCFVEQLLDRYAAHPAFRQVSWKSLQSPYPRRESFALHFPHEFRMNCLHYRLHLQEIGAIPR